MERTGTYTSVGGILNAGKTWSRSKPPQPRDPRPFVATTLAPRPEPG